MVPLGQGAGKIIDPFNINVGEACSCMYCYSAVGSCEACLLISRAAVRERLCKIQCAPWRPTYSACNRVSGF